MGAAVAMGSPTSAEGNGNYFIFGLSICNQTLDYSVLFLHINVWVVSYISLDIKGNKLRDNTELTKNLGTRPN